MQILDVPHLKINKTEMNSDNQEIALVVLISITYWIFKVCYWICYGVLVSLISENTDRRYDEQKLQSNNKVIEDQIHSI